MHAQLSLLSVLKQINDEREMQAEFYMSTQISLQSQTRGLYCSIKIGLTAHLQSFRDFQICIVV